MLTTAGTGLAAPFAELMRRKNAAMQTVEDFSVGEGGAKGTVQGEEVRVGSLAEVRSVGHSRDGGAEDGVAGGADVAAGAGAAGERD